MVTTRHIRRKNRKVPILEKIMALLALVNFTLVLFNISYITFRDFYFDYVPSLTKIYDPIKGIRPNRDTEKYLNSFTELKTKISTGFDSLEVKKQLEELQELSIDMINQNPFAVANKSGSLEKIKNRIRDKIPNPEDSAKGSFTTFWSAEYLIANGWNKESEWFEKEIQPLIVKNYYRGIGESGGLTDYFGIIDFPFIIIFGLEFLGRTFLISRRYPSVSWQEAMLWRWYDIFLLLPFLQLSRIIPVTIRLNNAQIIDLETIRAQASRGFLASIAQELTEVVIIQIINQLQKDVASGELAKRIFSSQQRTYIDLNNINEIEAITNKLVEITVCKVIPEIKSEIEALIRYNVEKIIEELPAFQTLQQIPGVENLAKQLSERLVKELSNIVTEGPQNAYETVKVAMADPEGTKLSEELVQHFSKELSQELQQENTLDELQSLISAFLEEVKINYVMGMSEEDVEKILEETRQLQLKANKSN
ncbi:hypothetical protein [Okeania sp.]|uniref:hypothetical protein n=1 Tax=Okeania sp. TaxID=3100323 RepID=UPI002B4B44D6|nr:hypothetical protein [Okeania sp.]MEB3340077.1 hypothetical protein [Okeania sp.]